MGLQDTCQRGGDVKRSSWDEVFHLLNNPVSHGGGRRSVSGGLHWSHLCVNWPPSPIDQMFGEPWCVKGGEKSRDWAEAEIEKTRDSCDFCKPTQFTVIIHQSIDNGNHTNLRNKAR